MLGHDCGIDGFAIRTLTGYMPEHDCLPPDVTATELVTHLGRMSGLPATAAGSGPPIRCGTSGCTRSGTGRSAPTRPA